MTRPAFDSAALYGTADAGVLGTETPLSITIRRFLAGNPSAAQALTGQLRLPTLVQYDPADRFFESLDDGTLVFSADGGIPLVRYHIADEGGVIG
jgi:phenylacetate-CoA ligase